MMSSRVLPATQLALIPALMRIMSLGIRFRLPARRGDGGALAEQVRAEVCVALPPAVQARRLDVRSRPVLGLAVLRPASVARAERLNDVRAVASDGAHWVASNLRS